MPRSLVQSIKQLSLVSVAGCGPFKANLAGPSEAHTKLIASCYRIACSPHPRPHPMSPLVQFTTQGTVNLQLEQIPSIPSVSLRILVQCY